jgi:hypothetical protein
LAAVEGEGCEAGDGVSGVALEGGVEGWVNLRWLVLAYTNNPHTNNIYNVWWCGGRALTVHTRLNRILSRSQLRGESEGQRSCDGSKSNSDWLHGGESVGLILLQLPHSMAGVFTLYLCIYLVSGVSATAPRPSATDDPLVSSTAI